MRKQILVGILCLVLLVAGVIFASAAYSNGSASEEKVAVAEVGAVCGCGCGSQCDGTCGLDSCGCGNR
jgi:hypothetical protein